MATESWCKVASNLDSHPKIRRGGSVCREVYCFALRRNAEPGNQVPGVVPASMMEPWFIADQLMISEADASRGLDKALEVGLLERHPVTGTISIVGWDDSWGRASKTSAERQAEYRARKRGDSPALTKKTYAIEQVGSGFVKIGRAANIGQRLYDLQVASPLPLRLVAFSMSDSESLLHGRLSDFRVTGEWFRLEPASLRIIGDVLTLSDTPPDDDSVTSPVTLLNDSDMKSVEERRGDKTRVEKRRVIPPSAAQQEPPDKVDEAKLPRKHRLPDDWSPDQSEVNAKAETAARSRGVDLTVELLKLQDWARSGAHKRTDWNAVWRNWTRSARAANGRGFAINPSPTQVALDELDRIEREERSQREAV